MGMELWLTEKRPWGFLGDGNALYPDRGLGSRGPCVYQDTVNVGLRRTHFMIGNITLKEKNMYTNIASR